MYGALANTPTCQMIPPGLPGYHRYCPYRLDLTRNGRWIAPNLQRAHALADTSNTRGKAVTIWDITDTGSAEPLVPYLARLLRHLGYRPDIHVLTPGATEPTVTSRSRPRRPAPSHFRPGLPHTSDSSRSHAPQTPRRRRVKRAASEQQTSSDGSAQQWEPRQVSQRGATMRSNNAVGSASAA
jgi:hypothetical protein